MKQLEIILKRLSNPSVIISIASQIVTILILFKVQVDMNLVTGVITAVSSILVLLGIVSDPDTQTKGYGDDIQHCTNCNKDTQHVLLGNKMVCKECGNISTVLPIVSEN